MPSGTGAGMESEKVMLNYIAQLNMFENLCTGILPPNAQIIYYKLFKWSNRIGLGEPFRLSNSILMFETGILNEKTFINNRNILKQRGFIDFQPGKKGCPTEYVLIDLTNTTVNTTVNNTVDSTGNVTGLPTVNVTGNVTGINGFLQSVNNKTNKQTNNPPKPPKGKKAQTYDNEFETFWKEYPRGDGKAMASKAFAKARQKTSLEILLAALQQFKESYDWQKDGGTYIPHASTWLNQERWRDKLDEVEPELPFADPEDVTPKTRFYAGYELEE